MKRSRLVPLGLVLLSMFLSACGGIVPEVSPVSESPVRAAEPEMVPSAPTPTPAIATIKPSVGKGNGSISLAIVEKAITDLAEHLDASKDQIRVIEAKAVTWPDASLGCPQPGMVYAQVATPGYLVQLESTGQVYRYHTDLESAFIFCDPEEKEENKNVEDGWPSQPKDNVIIKRTPTKSP